MNAWYIAWWYLCLISVRLVCRVCLSRFAFSRPPVADKVNGPLFDSQEVAHFRSIWEDWFRARVVFYETVDWSVAPGQPYALRDLKLLAKALGDKDVALWTALQAGVPTGVSNDIVPSNCFIPVETGAESADSYEFQVCAGNWPGAVTFHTG